ncbi:MAG: MFS transporter [Candidatus Bathyarchaeia archaeon]|jgi:predicted MFS family arabinose efflux permease
MPFIHSTNRLFLPALAISTFAVTISNGLVTLLLLEIASTFQVNEGVAAQLRTVNAFAEVSCGLLMSVLTIRFRHKPLLLTGLALVSFSAVGSFFASTLELLLFFSFLEGAGSIIFIILAFTMVGNVISSDKKVQAVGWLVAVGYVFSFISTPLINLFANLGSWRYTFLLLVLPVSVIGFILVFLGVPSVDTLTRLQMSHAEAYLRDLKRIFLNKSVISSIVGGFFFYRLFNRRFRDCFL